MAKKPFLSGYKTYDTSEGHGNKKQWRKTFNERMNQQEAKEILKEKVKDVYTILEVTKDATEVEIKKKYRELIKKWHPDKHNNSAESNQMTREIVAAYTLLTGK